MRIHLASLVRPVSRSVSICDDSIVLIYGRLAVMLFVILTGSIFGVALFYRCIFTPESVIADV